MVEQASNIPPADTFIKRPFGIGAFIGLLGSILNIVGIFFPWLYALADRIYWINGTELPIGWFTFLASLLAIICFVFRTRTSYVLGCFFGVFALAISAPIFIVIQLDSFILVGGLCYSVVGSILMTIGGIIGFLKSPKKEPAINN